jgi:hypothetical protein
MANLHIELLLDKEGSRAREWREEWNDANMFLRKSRTFKLCTYLLSKDSRVYKLQHVFEEAKTYVQISAHSKNHECTKCSLIQAPNVISASLESDPSQADWPL